MRTVLLGFACVLAAAACSRDSAPADALSTTDSAGVQIVRVTATAPDTAAIEQVLDIGSVEGEPEYQLHRVNQLARLSDGTIVAANGSTELRFYAPDGTYLRTVGRQGEGPGEFRSISYLRRLRGDSLLVYDARNRRVSIIAPDGGTRDYTPPSGGEGFPRQVVAALEDGTLLLRQSTNLPERSQDLRRDTSTFTIADSAVIADLGTYAGSERQIQIDGTRENIVSVFISEIPFSRDVFTAATADAFIIAMNETFEVHEYDASGALRRVLRREDITPRPVDDALVAEYVDARIADIQARAPERPDAPPPDVQGIRKRLEALPRVPTAPVHGGILVAEDGALWVKHHALTATGPTSWDVYAPDGSVRHTLTLPDRFTPMTVHDDVVYGVARDELDVEHVVAFRVR